MKKFDLKELAAIDGHPRMLEDFKGVILSYGCFVLKNSFKTEYITDVHNALEKLFSKPEKEKQKYKVKKPTMPGFVPYGVSRAIDTGLPNPLEMWNAGVSRENWPVDMKGESDLIADYNSKLYAIAHASLGLISSALGVPPKDLQSLIHKKSGKMRLIHYFKLDGRFEKKSRRQSKHCDNSLLTLIPPPNPISTGVSLFNRKTKKWETVIVRKDECLVQAGLLLQRLTNDKVKANLHTVNNPKIGSTENSERFSTPFFLNPDSDVILRVFDKFRKGKKIYPDVSVKKVQKEFYNRIFKKK